MAPDSDPSWEPEIKSLMSCDYFHFREAAIAGIIVIVVVPAENNSILISSSMHKNSFRYKTVKRKGMCEL
jgi:hypothetical protein